MLSVTYSYTGGSAVTVEMAETTTAAAQTAAIQSALNAVAGHVGGTVSLSAGTFTLIGTGVASDGCLRIGSNTTFAGAGQGQTVLRLADGAGTTTGILRTDSGQTLPDGSVKTTEHVLIRDLTIDGNRAGTTGDVDGFFCGAKPNSGVADMDIALDRVEITNVSRYGFDPHEQTIGLSITNSAAHHNGQDGFVVDFSSNVTLSGNTSYANGRHGFNIVTGSTNVTMTGNDAWGNLGSGITIQTGDNEARGFTSNVTVSGGSVHDNARYGIEAKQANDIHIDHVAVVSNALGGIVMRGVDHADLTANTVTGNGGSQQIRSEGYLQTFGDTDALNDRYIATHGVTIDGVAQTDPAVPVGVTLWNWIITSGDDYIVGTDGADRFAAGSGNDTVYGGAGNDLIYGGDGNDLLSGGIGNDSLYGGWGNDTLTYQSGFDVLDGGAGTDTADFSASASAVYVNLGISGIEAWTSGSATATAATSTTAIADLNSVETIVGSAFNDLLMGNGSANTLIGGAGNDTLSGGGGNDTLKGGAGNDVLNGGTGTDVFVFTAGWGSDTIQDFARGKDKIDIADVPGLTSFAQLSLTTVAGGTDITYGNDHIMVSGLSASQLTAADFVFH